MATKTEFKEKILLTCSSKGGKGNMCLVDMYYDHTKDTQVLFVNEFELVKLLHSHLMLLPTFTAGIIFLLVELS